MRASESLLRQKVINNQENYLDHVLSNLECIHKAHELFRERSYLLDQLIKTSDTCERRIFDHYHEKITALDASDPLYLVRKQETLDQCWHAISHLKDQIDEIRANIIVTPLNEGL